MIKFGTFLTEDKGGKNLHLEHIEDEILNYGITGGFEHPLTLFVL